MKTAANLKSMKSFFSIVRSTRYVLSLIIVFAFLWNNANAQTQNWTPASNATDVVFMPGNVGIGVNPPTSTLDVAKTGEDAYLTIRRMGTAASPYGFAGIKIGGTLVMSIGAYPSYGSGTLNIGNGSGRTVIGNAGASVCFGGIVPSGYSAGLYNFSGTTWSTSSVVSPFSSNGPTAWGPAPGYIFAVNGKSNLVQGVAIGAASLSTGAILSVNGNSTFSGTTSIGSVPSMPGGYKLYVADGILTEKVKVAIKTTANWSDFVFAKDYQLPSLDQVEQYINKNRHLEGIPSAEQVVQEGLDLGQMDAKLLMKLEEVTLYLIQMKKEIEELKKANTALRNEQFGN